MDPFWEDALETGDVAALREILDRGGDVNARDHHGQTALMRAAHAGQRELTELLLSHGADANVTAKYGLSALMLAVVARREDVARRLAGSGCDLALTGSGAPGFAGKTAADLALAANLPDLARELSPKK